MAELQQIIAQKGPLPIKTTATIETDVQTVLTLAGSVWTTTQDCMIGIALTVDGEPAVTAQIYSNGPDTHRAVVPVTAPYTFTIGEHVFSLGPLTPQTTSDFNDYFSVTVQY